MFTRSTTNDLNANWRSIDYCAIDVETTGLNLKEHEPISLGAAQIHKGRITVENNFYREIRPHRSPSIPSVQIHGLRGIDLESIASIESVLKFLIHSRANVVLKNQPQPKLRER